MSKEKKTYDVQDVIDAGYQLKPLECRYCGSTEVTFNSLIMDAHCGDCGRHQLEPAEDNDEMQAIANFESIWLTVYLDYRGYEIPHKVKIKINGNNPNDAEIISICDDPDSEDKLYEELNSNEEKIDRYLERKNSEINEAVRKEVHKQLGIVI